MSTPEGRIKKEIRNGLDSLAPDVFYLVKDQGAFSVRGLPDLILCVRGKFFAVEVKAKSKKARKLQEYHLNAIISAGGRALITSDAKELLDCVRGML